MKAIGINAGAGGLTQGVQNYFEVEMHLSSSRFGITTAQEFCEVDCHDLSTLAPVDFAFGHPRSQAEAIEVVAIGTLLADIVMLQWKQPTTAIDKQFVAGLASPGFRVAHINLNLISFEMPINSRELIVVLYREGKNFNIAPPALGSRLNVLYDWLWKSRNEPAVEYAGNEYASNMYTPLPGGWPLVVQNLPRGWSLETLIEYAPKVIGLNPGLELETWWRTGPIPTDPPARTNWTLPVSCFSEHATRLIHPTAHRPLTYGEHAAIFGWPAVPTGDEPVSVMALSGSPHVGKWLAEQAYHYLTDVWKDQDYQSRYDEPSGEWVGKACAGEPIKLFDLNSYYCRDFDKFDYDKSIMLPDRRLKLNNITRKWEPAA